MAEEKQFSAKIRAGKFAQEAFAKSGVKSLRQTLVRDKLPFVALVTSKFDDAAAPWKLLGFDGERTVAIETAESGRKLVFRYPAGQTKLDDFPHALHEVRADGVFAGTEGFLLSEDKRSASPDKAYLAKQLQTGKAFETSLRW